MDHKYWEEQLHAYLDRELDPADHRAVEKHMEDCADCRANYEYFKAMQNRLRAHAATVSIPPVVEERLHSLFKPKKVVAFPKRWIYAGLALAAVLLIGFIIEPMVNPRYSFQEGTYVGNVVCHDCTVAHRAGLARGVLCEDGHKQGLVTDGGRLFRIASDEIGMSYMKDPTIYGNRVRVVGELIKAKGLLRIQKMELVAPKRASLY